MPAQADSPDCKRMLPASADDTELSGIERQMRRAIAQLAVEADNHIASCTARTYSDPLRRALDRASKPLGSTGMHWNEQLAS